MKTETKVQHTPTSLDVTGLSHDLQDLKYKPFQIDGIVRAVNEYDFLRNSAQALFERTQSLEKQVDSLKDCHEELIGTLRDVMANIDY